MGGGDHLGGAVDALDVGGGPAAGEGAGEFAGAAAEVGDAERGGRVDLRDQFEERAAALVGEGRVLLGVPQIS